jgi:hypothetical protein
MANQRPDARLLAAQFQIETPLDRLDVRAQAIVDGLRQVSRLGASGIGHHEALYESPARHRRCVGSFESVES